MGLSAKIITKLKDRDSAALHLANTSVNEMSRPVGSWEMAYFAAGDVNSQPRLQPMEAQLHLCHEVDVGSADVQHNPPASLSSSHRDVLTEVVSIV